MIIKNNIIPFKGYKAINLFGIIFTRKDLNDIDLNHEKIHTAQMKEMLYIFFYIWYLIEYLVITLCNLSMSQNQRYHKIRFEKEAYDNQDNLDYLNTRKHYSWLIEIRTSK